MCRIDPRPAQDDASLRDEFCEEEGGEESRKRDLMSNSKQELADKGHGHCGVLANGRPSCCPPGFNNLRVTFQQKYQTESPKHRPSSGTFRDTLSPSLWSTSKYPLSFTHSANELNSSDLDLKAWDANTELETHTDRLLRLTRDLYEATHLPDVAIAWSEQSTELQSLRSCQHKGVQKERPDKDPKTREKVTLTEGERSVLSSGRVFQFHGADVGVALRALLDLVDEHWNGKFSLHLNPNFMAQAVRLLSPLTSSAAQTQSLERNSKEKDESRTWTESGFAFHACEVGRLRRQLDRTRKEHGSLKKRLITVLKENYILRRDYVKMLACLKSETLDASVHLERESELLQEQGKLLKQLEQTVSLLQSNQRSLVSHNNLLQNVIKRRTNKD